jgi:hypothetical protein
LFTRQLQQLDPAECFEEYLVVTAAVLINERNQREDIAAPQDDEDMLIARVADGVGFDETKADAIRARLVVLILQVDEPAVIIRKKLRVPELVD